MCYSGAALGSFNPKPKAMAGASSRLSIPLPAIAFGFGSNGEDNKSPVILQPCESP